MFDRTARGSKAHCGAARHAEAGIMIGECLVYISIWSVLMGLAFTAFYRTLDNARALRRNAADIVRAVNTGERWREDVRGATRPIRLVAMEGSMDQALHIPGREGEVIYYFTGTNMLRRANVDAPWVEALGGVKTSRMQRDARDRVASWRWELELNPGKRKVKLRPLFTFQAAAAWKDIP
jgi:hypothetical protein